jgi:myosin heavy chain 9/10/11/14
LREEREKALRLERELEGWKALRVEKGANLSMGSIRRSGQWMSGTPMGSERGTEERGIDIPKRKSSLKREASMSKGFL